MTGDALPSPILNRVRDASLMNRLSASATGEIGRGVGAVNLVERLEDACLMFRGDARTPCLSH